MDLIRYPISKDSAGRITLWCSDCPTPGPRVPLIPIWNEDDAAEQVTELCLANLVAIAEEHEREHHADGCPHCPDGHREPTTRPWAVWVTETRVDGQPPYLMVAPTNGAHVSESDAEWLREVIRSTWRQPAQVAPVPPPGSYWTDLAGKVWDLSCQYLDRHHRLFRVSGITEHGPVLSCIQLPNLRFSLAYVVDKHGPLVAVPPRVELESTHYGNGTHGGIAPHKGKRDNCPAPECLDAEADEREERDEETRRVRILLNAVGRFIETWAESDEQARTDLWRGLSAAADPVADLFESRIADLDHRAAQLPDGGLATKPTAFDLSALLEPAPSTPAPHRVKVRTVHVLRDGAWHDEPDYDVQHTSQCDALPYGQECWLDYEHGMTGTDDWPTKPGEYVATGRSEKSFNGETTEYDFYVDFEPALAAEETTDAAR